MWQRIQTLYFLLAAGLITVLLLGDVFDDVRYISKLPYAVLIIGSLAAVVVALFSFRKRPLQIRLAAVAGVFLIALQVWLAVDYFRFREVVFHWSAVFPLVAAYLDVLAIKGIYSDELLVRTSARLRSSVKKAKR